ncbi:DUF4191 domain-containing protein [Solicola gregarius]|uniref:DUF4191 domain-containing protein n=1 Tax=Solicola gregarius TaxID=2908642 RepID=A0AA46THI0_9ACTN|nr:DUF4191 domain-containing protein [Solicola gregarius]UYM05454.1 DUF4191 domain-containing protein [Solicola gregarius]
MSTPAAEPPKGRLRQIAQAYRITKRSERFIGLRLLAWFVVVGGIFGALGYVIMGLWLAIPLAILTGFLAAVIVFGRRAEKAAYAQIDGQVGAAAGALQMLKRGWHVKTAVAFTKNQDVLHRVVGRPGIILVGEGVPTRVRNLLAAEKKKHARVAGGVPIIDIVVGDDDGQVKIPKLIKHIQKLPKSTTPAEITELMQRLRALDAMRPQAPVPHGPVPTSMKGARKLMQGR